MIKVLIAEDEVLERNFLVATLNKLKASYKIVGIAKNGREAIQISKEQKPDIAIVDIAMPFVNGIEAASKMKLDHPTLQIILNTAYFEYEYAKVAIHNNFSDYLLKPTTEHQIIESLNVVREQIIQRISDKNARSEDLTKDLIDRVVAYINENLTDPSLSLSSTAKSLYINTSYLSRLFSLKVGTNFTAYIRKRRLEQALQLVQTTSLTIEQVWRSCGFSSASNFYSAFKVEFNSTPNNFREGDYHEHY